MNACLGACLLALTTLQAVPCAAQQRPSATLDYAAPATADCPDEQAFRDIVATRLGYDPFTAAGAMAIEAHVVVQAQHLVGHVRFHEASGKLVGDRQIEGAANDCQELTSALAIAISVALDPLADPEAPSPAPPASPLPPQAAPPGPVAAAIEAPAPAQDASPQPPATKEPQRVRAAFSGHAGASTALGLTPGPALGPVLAVGLKLSNWTALVEARLDLMPVAVSSDGGQRIEAAIYGAGPAGCLSFGLGLACVAVELGAFQGRGVDVADSRTQTSFFAAGSARAGLSLPLGSVLALRLLGELRVPLVRTSLSIDGRSVWNAPALAGGLRLELSATFL